MATDTTNNNSSAESNIDSNAKQEMNVSTKPSADETGTPVQDTSQPKSGHPWEDELDVYPLRSADEDPKWAIRIVKTWIYIAISSGLFVIALIILGFFFD